MKIVKILLFIIVLGLAVLFYARKIEPNMLKIEYVGLESDIVPEGLKVAVLSDIHLKSDYPAEKLERIVEKTNEENPDIVIFLGDLFENFSVYEGEKEDIVNSFKALDAKLKFCVYGNHDYGGKAKNVYREIMEEAGFYIFKNDSFATEYGINFIGLDDYIFGEKSKEIMGSESLYNFAFAHAPDSLKQVFGFDFFVAGHSHGGQIYVPFVKPFWLPAGSDELGYWRGRYETESGATVYVSRGIGTSMYTLRFLTVPEITICKFSKKSVEK